MNAKKCDRCGKFYEPYTIQDNRFPFEVNGIAFCRIYAGGESRAFDNNSHDLCEECFEAMHAFFKNAEQPAAKKHGRWIDNKYVYSCSECNDSIPHNAFINGCDFEYCPYCGAIMDGGTNNVDD